MPKQSRLGDNAEIYQPRKNQSEKEKLSDMPFKKRVDYLWEYYRTPAFVIIVAAALVIYIVYTIFAPKAKVELNAVFLQNTIDEQVLEDYKTQFSDYLKLDRKKQEIIFNTNFYDTDSAMQALNAYAAAQELDVIIVPASRFETFAKIGFFDKLSDPLPTDLYSSMTNRFYITNTQDDPDNSAYGIYLSDSDLFKNNASSADPYVLGIVANSKHKDNTVEFIRYLFKQFP